MSILNITNDFKVDESILIATSNNFAHEFKNSKPCKHIKFENFINNEILEKILKDFAIMKKESFTTYNRKQEKNKKVHSPYELSNFSLCFFNFLNSKIFINFLENLTGINGLIPDPYFTGGGIHEVANGGYLNIHADFNLHPKMKLERRINLLIYLNKDWENKYGGQFELWDSKMESMQHSFDPIFNRCIILNTTSYSYHGNPNPVNHPNNLSRLSIALYYYSATWNNTKKYHTTKFQIRPNTIDKYDWLFNFKLIIIDITPPFFVRNFKKIGKQIKNFISKKTK